MKKLRVGVVGPGRIVHRVMKDFYKAENVELTAIASRSLARAKEAAEEYGAKYAFGSYREMAECDEVDAAYIATPHPFHCEQAILMMSHGKHVICEKPVSISEAETRLMTECARQNHVFLMEAMWSRFFPATKKMMNLLKEREIGEIRHVDALFSSQAGKADIQSRLFNPELAGGAMLDIGVYPLMATTHLLGWNPEKIQGLYRLTETGVDSAMSVQMQYANGATAQIMTSLDAFAPSFMMIYGTKGYIRMCDYWHPASFTLVTIDGTSMEYTFHAENEGFFYEFEEAAKCIRDGLFESPLMPWQESIAVSRITEQLRHEAGVFYPQECTGQQKTDA